MTAAQTACVVSLVVAGGLLPVGASRMLVYRFGELTVGSLATGASPV